MKRPLLGAAVALCFSAPVAHANPTGPTVVSGSASFAASGSTLSVTNTPGAIINWQQFSIQQNEITRFIQQNAASAVLNRVTSGIPSAILGTLSSNGRVYLINASGIAIGRGAMIDVAGFAASTLNLSDTDFIGGRHLFQGTGAEGAIVNAGTIRTAEGGHVYLVAPKVENQKDAVITSPKGEIFVAAGKTVELVNAQSPDVRVELTAAGEAVNAGALVAASGQVGIFGTLVRNSGLVSASRAVVGPGGKIVFRSSGDTLLEAGSRVEATGDKGGTIQVLGNRVGVLDGASIDASGDAGGGTVLVGGDFQGRNAQVQNAARTYVGADATIKADALQSGDGGKVIVWADDVTRAYGTISARGGAQGGDGGFVEVSGKNQLDFAARVDASAPNGAAGTLLLDPTNITVAVGGGATTAQVDAFADAGATLSISPATLNAAGTTVVLQAQRDVNIDAPVNIAAPGVAFTAQAGRDINVDAALTTNAGRIILEADSPHQTGLVPDGDGLVRINAPVNSCGGAIPAGCTGANITLIGGGNSSPTGGFALNADVNAGTGGINVSLSTDTGLDFFIGAGGNTQLSSNDTGSLKTTGTLVLGRATSGGPNGLGAPVTENASTGAVTLTVDSLSQLNSTPMVLSAESGSTFQLVAGDGGITLDRDLTSFQTTLIDTSGTFTLGAALDTTNSNLVITAASVDISGGSVTTGTGVFGCSGAGCPAGTSPVNQWIVDASGDWLLGTNWLLGTPTSGQVVLIDRPSASPTVSLGSALSPADGFAGLLVNSEILNITGNSTTKSTLSITADITHNGTTASSNLGTLNLDNASIGGAGALANFGTLNLTDSALNVALLNEGAGAVINAAGVNTIAGAFSMLGGSLGITSGATTLSGNGNYAGSVTVDSGATLSLAGGAHNVLAGGIVAGQAGSVIQVAGAAASVNAAATFTADALEVSSGSLALHNAAVASTLALSGGTVEGTGDLTVSTDFVQTGGTLGSTFSDLELHKAGAFVVPGFTAVDSLKLIASGAVTLNGAVVTTVGGGDSIVIKGSSFTNNVAGTALDAGAGRFLVWSGNPASDDRGDQTYDFKQYNASFGSTSVLGTGDGFLYTTAPTVTAGLTGAVSKGYDANIDATLAAGNFTVGGAIDGDTVTLNNPASGSYDTKNVDINKTVSVSGIAIATATDGAATVYGYQLASTSASAAIGEITPAPLTVTANDAAKTYGQTTTFAGTEFTSSGLVGGETIGSVTLASLGAAATANVAGSPYAITPSAATGGTFSTGNYTITYNDGALTISPAALSVTASNAAKTYGQTTTFAGTEFSSSGLQNGETIGSVTLASLGAAATANVAGSPYAITPSAATGGTFTSGNYTITYNNGSLTISPAALSVTANNAAKTYGQTTTFAGTEFSSSGLQNGETIGSVSLASLGAAATANVAGSPYAITPSAATGGTFATGNYTITYNDGSLTISPAALSVTANNAAKTYGQTTTFAGTEFSSSGLQNGETIGSVSLASLGAAATAGVAGSPYAITPSAATGGTFSTGNYTITYNDGALTISPAALSVTANNAAKTYGQTTTFAGTEFTSSGLQNGESIGSVTLASAGAAATANVAGSPYAITPSAATGGTFTGGNYTITYNDGALTISPAALSVTANNAAKTYGQTTTFAGTEFTSSGLQNGETIGSVTLASLGAAATANVAGSPYAITASAATGGTFSTGNYTITYNDGSLTISPAALAVTANNAAKSYGQTTTFAGTEFTSSGLQNGETIGSVTLASLGAAATADVAGSPYAITPSAASGGTFSTGNYTITYNNGSLTISPAALSVTANNAAKTYGQTTTFAGTEFSSSGLQNGETIGSVTLASAGAAPTANVAGSPYAITASAATGGTFSTGNYTITYNDGSLTISPAALSVTADNAAKTYGQTVNFAGTEFTSSGLQNGETIGSVTLASAGAAATANVAGSPYAITASAATGGTFSTGNYTISYNDGALTISPAALSVTANNAAKSYGQTVTFNGTEFSSSGLQNGETIGSVSLASLGAAATANVAGSPYAITPSAATGGTFASGNYTITYNDGALTISSAALSVTANNAAKTYGQTTTFNGTEFTTSGLQNGETIGSVTLASLGAAATAGVAGSPYAITPSAATGGTFTSGNYTISYNNGSLTISPAALSVTANNAAKTYGQTTTFAGTEFSSSGLQNGETIGSVSLASLGAAATANVAGSPYAITPSAATGGTFSTGNYTITYNNGSLTISPAALSVTANNAAKTYGQTVTFNGTEFGSSGLQNGETIGSVTLASLGAAPTADVAGSPYTITPSAATGGTFAAGNYTISYNNGSLTVSPAALAVTANNAAKTYGQTVTFNGSEFSSSGLQNGETIGSVTLASLGAGATANVAGSPYAITPSAATGGTFTSGNYTITYNNGSLTISPAALSVTANNAAKTYGQTTTFAGTEFSSSGLQNGETIGSVSLASLGAAATAGVAGSPYAITPSAATGGTFAAGNYTISYNNGSLTISPAALSVTASNAAKTYGQTTTFAGTEFTSSGLQNGESIGSVTLASAGAAAAANVAGSPYAIAASAATGGTFTSGNYTITYNNGALTISPAALSVTANNAAKTYGQTTTFAGTEFSSSGLQNGETIGSISLASLGAGATAGVAGTPYAITPSAATGGTFSTGNYTITYNDGALTISPAALSVTANNAAKTYGQTVTFNGTEFTSSGLQNGESIGSVSLASPGTAAAAGVAGSPYAITASAASGGTFASGNYTITYNNGALTISPAALSVTASNAAKTYGQTTTFAGSEFTSSGLQNGETIGSVTLASAGAAATANVAGSPYAITPSAATGGTFAAGNYTISYNNGALTISPAALAVTANNAAKTYGQTTTFAGTEFSTSGLQNGDTIGSVTLASLGAAPTASVAGGPYAITPSAATGGTFSSGNYTISYNNGALTISPAALSVTASDAAKTYGQTMTFAGTEFTSSGLQNGETIGSVTLASPGAAPTASVAGGPYAITPSAAAGGTFAAGNYTITYNNGTLTISPAALLVAANNASKTYGDTLAFAGSEFTASGLQNGETIGSVALASAGAAPGASVAGGPYAITAGGANGGTFSAGNYAISYQDGTLTISPALLTYLADAASRASDQPDPIFTGQVTGFVNGETELTATTGSLLWTTGATAGSPAGSYDITGGGLTALNGNYSFTQAASNASAFTITTAVAIPPNLTPTTQSPSVPETSGPTQPTVDQTLLNLNTGETLFVPPNTIPDPGIYLSQDSSSVVVVGASDLGSSLNIASTLLFPVVTPQWGTYVNSENGLLYVVDEGAVLDPGVYYNREDQTVLVVTTDEEGVVTVSSADIKDAVQTVASGAGGKRVVSVACK